MFRGFTDLAALTAGADPDRDGRARRLGGGDRAGRRHRPVAAGAPRPPAVQPPDHHDDPDAAAPGRPPAAHCCAPTPTPPGARCSARSTTAPAAITPWGTILSGEENFNQYFVGGERRRRAADRAAYARYGIDTANRLPARLPAVGPGGPALRPGEGAERGQPVRLGRRGRPVPAGLDAAQAHRARPVEARGRDDRGGQGRPGRRVHGRRRALRLHLQVRLRPGGCAAAAAGAAREWNKRLLEDGTLYVARFTGDSPAAEIDGSGRCRPTAPSTGPGSGSRSPTAGAASCRASPSSRCWSTPGWPPTPPAPPRWTGPRTWSRTRSTGKVYCALTNNSTGRTPALVDEPNPPVADRGGRGQRGEQPVRPHPGDHRDRGRRRGDDLPLGPADRLRRPGRPVDVLRRLRQDEGQPDLLPGQRRLRRGRQPLDRHRRQPWRARRRTTGCSRCRWPVRSAGHLQAGSPACRSARRRAVR